MVPPDTQAVLLLCGTFGRGRQATVKPLSLSEYNALASWLARQGRRPASLLEPANELYAADEPGLPPLERVRALLGRGFQLAAVLEGWQRLGLWVMSRAEDAYPERLRRHLRSAAPPLLFGAGDPARLAQGGLAIVGSRDAGEEPLSFAQRIGELCASQGVPIVSGGARGVDQAAATALEADGGAVIVLAERLDRAVTARDARQRLRAGRLCLVTPDEPESGFTVSKAIGQNKLIYALADFALVVHFTTGKGGTWAGAVEQLSRNQTGSVRVPVFVRGTGNPPDGVAELRCQGALLFPEVGLQDKRIVDVLTAALAPPTPDADAT